MSKTNQLIGVDTVKIALEDSAFRVTDFTGWKKMPRAMVFNPSMADKQSGRYWPQLSLLTPNNFNPGHRLEIEFSLPKMAFGNNVQEITLEDKQLLMSELTDRLQAIHVETTTEDILTASLQRVDFGKNIIGGNTTASLNCIKNTLLSQRRVTGQTDYINGGRSVRFRNASTDISFYDKLRDPDLSQKISLETDYYCQEELLKDLLKNGVDLLRMEFRAVKRKDVKRLFERFGIHSPIFADIFQTQLGKKIITEEWNKVMENYVPTMPTYKSLLGQAAELFKSNRGGKINPLFAAQFLQLLLKEHSVDEVKTVLSGYFSARSIRYFFNAQREIITGKTTERNTMDVITAQIEEWQAVRLPLTTDAPVIYNNIKGL